MLNAWVDDGTGVTTADIGKATCSVWLQSNKLLERRTWHLSFIILSLLSGNGRPPKPKSLRIKLTKQLNVWIVPMNLLDQPDLLTIHQNSQGFDSPVCSVCTDFNTSNLIQYTRSCPSRKTKTFINRRKWFSGKIQRCHRWAPGSIPGLRNLFGTGNGFISPTLLEANSSTYYLPWFMRHVRLFWSLPFRSLELPWTTFVLKDQTHVFLNLNWAS